MTTLKTSEKIKFAQAIIPRGYTNGLSVNGPAIDRLGYRYAAILFSHGAATGSPMTYSVAFHLEESADNSSWADVEGVAFTYNADSNTSDFDVYSLDLIGRKRYLRIVAVATLTGGSSPAMPVAVDMALSGYIREPVTN
jgi:hypothetical protein